MPPNRGGGSAGSYSEMSSSFISRFNDGSSSIRPWTSTRGSDLSVSSYRTFSNAAKIEDKINSLLEETVLLKEQKKFVEALEKAQEAVKKEQLIRKHDLSHDELMFSTLFNLASAYEANGMPDKAIKTFSIFLKKQKGHPSAGRVRILIGNILYAQGDYPSCIKSYEMALDQLSHEEQTIRSKVRRNIGNAFFRSGMLLQAIKNYKDVINSTPDSQAGFNLFLCHYALDDKDGMKQDLTTLASICAGSVIDDHSVYGEAVSTVSDDSDEHQATNHFSEQDHLLLTAARLVILSLDEGFDWVCTILEDENEQIVHRLHLERAVQRLKCREFRTAKKMIEVLQQKDRQVKAVATTNLSCLSFLGGDSDKASEYADIALEADRYNEKALVNKGNCCFIDGDFVSAKELYLEAIEFETDCFEAIYNLGLVNVQLGLADEAIETFERLHKLTPNNPEVIYQIADIYEIQGRTKEAIKWFSVLAARIPNDAHTLSRLGQLYQNIEESQEALHYQLESFRNFPVDLDVISWIGSYFVKKQMYEKSVFFFQQAALVQPNEAKWRTMSASALRRLEEKP